MQHLIQAALGQMHYICNHNLILFYHTLGETSGKPLESSQNNRIQTTIFLKFNIKKLTKQKIIKNKERKRPVNTLR